jgi:integrase
LRFCCTNREGTDDNRSWNCGAEGVADDPPVNALRRRQEPALLSAVPRVDYESHTVALDRNELGALLVAAGLGLPAWHALISLLALNGLRISEAAASDIEHLGLERGHRT